MDPRMNQHGLGGVFGLIGQYPRLAVVVLVLAVIAVTYGGISLYTASKMVAEQRIPISETPKDVGLTYHDVSFPSRDDGLRISGWFIPGVLPNGSLTVDRAILVVPGKDGNRADTGMGLLDLSAALARHGFAVLAIDMRGTGTSADAKFTGGLDEQRDVLGAIDFLRSGPLPYPELGRPRVIGGWGVSLGAQSLLYAGAREPALRAVVADSTFAEVLPVVEAKIPNPANLRGLIEPGALLVARIFYGVDYPAIRPAEVSAKFAPRPLLLIHGSEDVSAPPAHMERLAAAARLAPGAQVQTWLVEGAGHGRAFRVAGSAYVDRVVTFFDAALA